MVFNLYSNGKRKGTGFIGKINMEDGELLVLVTCYHVIIEDIHNYNRYWEATRISSDMTNQIEEHAKTFSIILNGKTIQLKDIMADRSTVITPGSSGISPRSSV